MKAMSINKEIEIDPQIVKKIIYSIIREETCNLRTPHSQRKTYTAMTSKIYTEIKKCVPEESAQ